MATASEFFPIVGLLAAALVFPQGVHSAHPIAYFVLAMSLNFALFFPLAWRLVSTLDAVVGSIKKFKLTFPLYARPLEFPPLSE